MFFKGQNYIFQQVVCITLVLNLIDKNSRNCTGYFSRNIDVFSRAKLIFQEEEVVCIKL